MTNPTDEITVLKRDRGILKSRLTRITNFMNVEANHQNLTQIKVRYNSIENLLKEFEILQNKIDALTNETSTELEDFETLYFIEISRMYALLYGKIAAPQENQNSNQGDTSSTSNVNSENSSVRLPTIELVSFNGAFDKWLEFHDSFQSLVHNNTKLSDIQRLLYLRSCLRGEAASVINALETSAENYSIAWELLKSRFNNRRAIIQNHLKAFVELPTMSKESAVDLRKLVDQTQIHLRALKSLGESVEHWDTIVIYLVTSKIDRVSHKEWEKSLADTTMPKLDTFIKFLENRCHILQATAFNVGSVNNNSNQKKVNSNCENKRQVFTSTNNTSCVLCQGSHKLYACDQFRKMSVYERAETAKSHSICFNCLNSGHRNNECKWQGCKKCNKKHNSLLHYDKKESNSNQNHENHSKSSSNTDEKNSVIQANCAMIPEQVLLSTALVDIENKDGTKIQARVLLDSGSQSNFITKKFADSLKLSHKSIDLPVQGLNQLKSRIKESLNTKIHSKQTSYSTSLEFLILPRICDYLPGQLINKQSLDIPKNFKLADPEFFKPREIDALIGVEIFYDLLCTGQVQLSGHKAKLTKTKLGWVISGKVGHDSNKIQSKQCFLSLESLQRDVAKFWEIEEITDKKFLSEEECQVENFYKETTCRDPSTGKIIVRLPFNEKISMLGDSYEMAKRRFLSTEKKLSQNPALKVEYDKFIHKYIELGHMSEVPDSAKHVGYFMPHHAVIKDSSETTKVRVVFDASAKSSTGISLNNCLKVGPTIQQDIFSIIARFRTHQFVLTTDIEKMYRQILVDKRDNIYQQLLYRENANEPLKIYRAKTVTYGTASAPYLAIRSVFYLADEVESQFPGVAKILKRDFYVDDGLTGTNTLDEALNLRDGLITVTNSAGLPLRKWASNEPKLLEGLPAEMASVDLFTKTETQGALGVQWNPSKDVLMYKVIDYDDSQVTKRKILSNITKIFDPIGLLGPVIVTTKILMQKLWQCEVGWDESVPIDVHTKWINIKNQLNLINSIEFNRKVIIKDAIQIEIHGFCDASEKAYGACIYIRSVNDKNEIMTNLLCSKNRVAPLKSISLPKLELCGALLLSRLLKCVSSALCKEVNNVYLWTDSTITLQWIQTQPYSLKTFVANRVSEIRTNTTGAIWRHVSSKDNPADSLSRGQLPAEFLQNKMWKEGPEWLKREQNQWPETKLEQVPLTELKSVVALQCTVTANPIAEMFKDYSSITHLKRVLAFCLRFINNASKSNLKETGPLKSYELNQSMNIIVKLTQEQSFPDELKSLSKSNSISKSSALKALNPFIDEDKMLRVGGRLTNSTLSYSEKHPLILPKDHHVTKLIIEETHKTQLHSGTQATLHAVRAKFWPVSGKSTTRQILKHCITCFRVKPINHSHIMGNLPSDRVIQARPFLNTGVDYCGPFYIKEHKFRNRGKVKVYAAIFVCFTTKACHIELVTDMTTDAFLASLRRFFARRGKSLNLYSDNGTNFVGADRELKSLIEFVKSNTFNNSMVESLANQGIQWHFSPPRSPHFGGLWEAAVKSFKNHFYRTVGNTLFTYEELYTYVTEIEAILNSRPITPLSSDPKDLNALSPAHFLIGDLLTTIPDQDLSHINQNRLSSWQHIQFVKQHFWKRWSKEYLHELNTRSKWQFQQAEEIKIGTMVILKEDNLPPLSWPLGRIIKVHPGSDGIVRVVTVKTNSGMYDRSVKLVAPLPFE